jgi:hypothetical protein
MDQVVISFGEVVCHVVSVSARCYNPDFSRLLGLTLLGMAAIIYVGSRMLRSS